MKSKNPKPERPPARQVPKPDSNQMNRPTDAEFEREGMGVAPKE
jgi:hypothetical protein